MNRLGYSEKLVSNQYQNERKYKTPYLKAIFKFIIQMDLYSKTTLKKCTMGWEILRYKKR